MKSIYRSVIISALVYACWVVIKGFGGVDLMLNQWAGWIVSAIMIALTLVFATQERKEQGGYMSYGSAFKTCIFLMLIPYFAGILFEYLYFTTILPDVVDSFHVKMEQNIMAELDKSEQEMPEEAREMAIKMGTGFSPYKPGGVAFVILSAGVLSAVFSAILAIFVKKLDPNAADEF